MNQMNAAISPPVNRQLEAKLYAFRRIAHEYAYYGTGENSDVLRREVWQFYRRIRQDPPLPVEEEISTWTGLAKRALDSTSPTDYCDSGAAMYNEASVLVGRPITLHRVHITKTIPFITLPPGADMLDPRDFLVTIRHRNGQYLLMDAEADIAMSNSQMRQAYDDDDDDDDFDDDYLDEDDDEEDDD